MAKTPASERETKGAWIVHHGEKVALDAYGPAEFPAIEEAAKAAALLSRLSASDDDLLDGKTVRAVAAAARLNPRRELESYLDTLEKKRLIRKEGDSVRVLGITPRAILGHAADLFDEGEPSNEEAAAIDVAERASEAPLEEHQVTEYVSDTYSMASQDTTDFVRRIEEIGFLDSEGEPGSRLYFNGNLFRRDTVRKTMDVLNSLSSSDQSKVVEFNDRLQSSGFSFIGDAERILGKILLDKMKAAGVYDLNVVSNPHGRFVFVTAPGAFHKFVNPMVDDAFDMAKALVAALGYGMTRSHSGRGRIQNINLLLGSLIAGNTIGPATAIGQDYRVLEHNRVVQIIPDGYMFRMKLLKREVGEIALQVLRQGDATPAALTLPSAAMTGYQGPEPTRSNFRKRDQSIPSKRHTREVLAALRSGRSF